MQQRQAAGMVSSFSPKRLMKALKRRLTLVRQLPGADVVVVSIKKSGRTWLRALLTRLFHDTYATPTDLLLDGGNHKALNPAAPSVLFAHDSDPVASVGEMAADLRVYDGSRVILLVRYPADTIVSLYHHYRNRKTGSRQRLAATTSIFEFASRPGHGIHSIIAFLNNWARYARHNNKVIMLKYEDLHADTAAELARLAALIGVPATPATLDDAIAFASLANLRKLETQGFFNDVSLRKTGATNPDALKVRRGQVKGYTDYFTPGQCAEIERIIADELDPWYGYQIPPAAAQA